MLNSTKITTIDGDRFAASLSDSKVAALIDASCAYGDSLDGRVSVPPIERRDVHRFGTPVVVERRSTRRAS